MIPYARLLLQHPRPTRVPSEAIASLLRDAGVDGPGSPSLARVAAQIGAEPSLLEAWLRGSEAASFRDLCCLAIALDRHPEFARRTPTAADDPRSMKTQLAGVRASSVPPPTSARSSAPPASRGGVTCSPVAPRAASPAPPSGHPSAASAPAAPSSPAPSPARAAKRAPAVRPGVAGIEVTIGRGATEGYDPSDYRNWLAAWLAARFEPPISVLLGAQSGALGVASELLDEAFEEYKALTRKGVWSAGHALLNAVADWGNQPDKRERHASLVRVASLRILEVAETHRDLFRLDLSEESALRSVAEAGADGWHRAIAEHSSKLFSCGRRIMDAWGRTGSAARSRSGSGARAR